MITLCINTWREERARGGSEGRTQQCRIKSQSGWSVNQVALCDSCDSESKIISKIQSQKNAGIRYT